MVDFQTSEIQQLVNLLNLEDKVDSDEECGIEPVKIKNLYSVVHNTTPASIIDEKQLRKTGKQYNYYSKSTISKDIWTDDEILDEDYDEAQMKEKPHYEMVYHQNVTPDDIFLQLDGKGPGTNSCECLLVKIKLSGTNSKDNISLKISTLSLICKTKKYYLDLDFPRHVDPGKCCSAWNQSDCLLIVKLFFDEGGL